MHPNDIKYTAVSTPQGAFEWVVMPMGFRNTPTIHQWWVAMALQKFIGRICHIYLDDIIIWSQDIEEHMRNMHTILNALKEANILSFRESWESARPVAFDSMTFKAAELNYPVHEKELL